MSNNRNYIAVINKLITTIKKLQKIQKYVRKHYAKQEQDWVKNFLQPIIDMMGSVTSTFPIFNDIKVHLYKSVRNFEKKYPNGKHAIYTGSHWIGIKDGKMFDPFDYCQLYGTNQFCQTYTLMWLTDNLTMYDKPQEGCQEISELDKYYFYTKQALDFIQEKILPKYNPNHHSIEEYWECIKVLKKYPMMCLNVIELPK